MGPARVRVCLVVWKSWPPTSMVTILELELELGLFLFKPLAGGSESANGGISEALKTQEPRIEETRD